MWAVLAPLGALVFSDVRAATRWYVAYVVVFLGSGIAGEVLGGVSPAPPAWFTTTMLALERGGRRHDRVHAAGAVRPAAPRRGRARCGSSRRSPRTSSSTSCRAPSPSNSRRRPSRSPISSTKPRSSSPTWSTSRRGRSSARRPRLDRGEVRPSALAVTPLAHHGGHGRAVRAPRRRPGGGRHLGGGDGARRRGGVPGGRSTDEVYAAIEDAMAEVAARAAADRDAAVQLALQQAAVLNREQLGTAADRACRPTWRRRRTSSTPASTRCAPRCAPSCSGSARWSASSARPAPSASARSTSRCAPTPRSPARSPTRRARCARRWPTRRPAASGASGWPRTCCASPASPSTSTTASRPRSPAAPGRPDYTFDLPKGHVLYMDVKFPLAVVPALPRGRHRRRAPGPPQALPRRRPAAGQGAGQARVRPRRRPPDRRLRAAVPAQRAAHRVHPRARPGAARRGAWPSAS